MNVDKIRGTFFLDTNILAYSFDRTAPDKQQIASTLIRESLVAKRGFISSQVVQEFVNLVIHKQRVAFSARELDTYMRNVLLPLCIHFPSFSTYEHALKLHRQTQYRWFDALILTAASELECTTIITEDMQHQQVVNGVTILNPFV